MIWDSSFFTLQVIVLKAYTMTSAFLFLLHK